MIWVDLLLGALALVVLGLVCFRLYRHVRVLLRTAGDSSTKLADATAQMNIPERTAPRR